MHEYVYVYACKFVWVGMCVRACVCLFVCLSVCSLLTASYYCVSRINHAISKVTPISWYKHTTQQNTKQQKCATHETREWVNARFQPKIMLFKQNTNIFYIFMVYLILAQYVLSDWRMYCIVFCWPFVCVTVCVYRSHSPYRYVSVCMCLYTIVIIVEVFNVYSSPRLYVFVHLYMVIINIRTKHVQWEFEKKIKHEETTKQL